MGKKRPFPCGFIHPVAQEDQEEKKPAHLQVGREAAGNGQRASQKAGSALRESPEKKHNRPELIRLEATRASCEVNRPLFAKAFPKDCCVCPCIREQTTPRLRLRGRAWSTGARGCLVGWWGDEQSSGGERTGRVAWGECTEGDEKQNNGPQPEYLRSHMLLSQKQT
ncbi:hypothetical protein B0T21DRAFT_351518 [Apiosordaria backusii]|uniref:Uncharacterized protein n=1 Tax=Apiosordaria backusii TaxID=314023 RepID=A0AA40AMR6_9PEZI|nr:hypothetical protein B0T21DRAFT_351518 [Apiosordaria backusii]